MLQGFSYLPMGFRGSSASRDWAEFNWPSASSFVFHFLWSLRYWPLPEDRCQTDDTQILSPFNISGLPGRYTNISAPPPQLQIYAITRGDFWLSSKALKRKIHFMFHQQKPRVSWDLKTSRRIVASVIYLKITDWSFSVNELFDHWKENFFKNQSHTHII